MYPKFKTKEEIPAPFVDLYEEKDGEFVFKDEGAAGLQSALDTERTKREAAERLATKAAKDLLKLQTDGKAKDGGITDEKLTEIRAAVRREVEEEFAPKIKAGEAAASEVRRLKLDGAVKSLAAKAGFLGDKVDDYWKLHGDEFDLTEDGKPMVKANPGQSVEKLIESHKEKRKEWVQGTKAGGGGAAGDQTTAPVNTGALTAEQILANPSLGISAVAAK